MSHASLGSLTVIVPVYNELDNLPELRRRLSSVVASLGVSGSEVILVSDGSTDGSEALMAEYVMNDPLFVAIFLTRNFGHQAAVSVGLAAASGDIVKCY